MEMGEVIDMLTEMANDDCQYNYIATQEDIDRL